MRGEVSHPMCGLVTPSLLGSPVKIPKLPGKESCWWRPFANSPWKAGKSESGRDEDRRPALAREVGRSSPHPIVWTPELRPSLHRRTCPSDFWKLSTFNVRPGPQGSPRKRPGYNYRLILPAETKPKSSLLPSSKQSLGNSEKLISGKELG